MANNRINAFSMATPDPFGNMYGMMVPSGVIQPTNDLIEKKKIEAANKDLYKLDPNYQRGVGQYTASAQNNALKPLEAPEDQKYEMNGGAATALSVGSGMSAYNTVKQAGGSTGISAAAGAIGAGASLASMAGENAKKNKKEDSAGALKGIGTGASIGASVGSIAGPVGTVIGGAVGAIAGGITGAIIGKKQMKKRKLLESQENDARNKYNKDIAEINRKNLVQAGDLDRYQQILQSAQSMSKGGLIKYKTGGLLRYDTLNIQEGLDYINSLKTARKQEQNKLENQPLTLEKFQDGGQIAEQEALKKLSEQIIIGKKKGMSNKQIAEALKVEEAMVNDIVLALEEQSKTQQPRVFKKGGKMFKKKSDCGCKKTELTTIFRRGGVIDLEKQNVIIDGPSHDEENNTGIKGDKGLPVVMNGKKIAEIESKELIINANSSKEIERLKGLAKKGDLQAKELLGEMLLKELHVNTYDYTDLMKD